jgi:hypothetical protein
MPGSAAIRIVRSRHEVLLDIPGDVNGWRYKTDSTPGAQSQFEFSRRALGAIRKVRVLIEADLVRRSVIATGAN